MTSIRYSNNKILRKRSRKDPCSNFHSYKDIDKLHKVITKNRVLCDCGHSVFIPAYKDTKICSWCYRTVYNTTLSHFKYKWRIENEIDR